MAAHHALLIGVNFYFRNRLPGGGYFSPLKGCVRDITHVDTYLRDVLHMQPENVTRLTISGDAEPLEPPDQWPTYENMVRQLQAVAARAQPGDHIYIHYSGHGGRAATAYPELKGAEGVDETLVPPNIGDPQARYLRDVEFHYLVEAMVQKGLVVTVVLDSCHSGGATRGLFGEGGAVARSAVPGGWIDTTPRPHDSDVAIKTAMLNAWSRPGPSQTRALKPGAGWLLEPRGYTLLAACRANESAYEFAFDGRERNGALTYWLLDTLRQASPETTYKMVYDRLLAKIHSHFELQTPMLQGEGELQVFGSERIPAHHTAVVMEVDVAARRLRLNAGAAHGLHAGAQFAIHAPGTTDFGPATEALARAEVSGISAVHSWARLVEPEAAMSVVPGAPAVLLGGVHVRLRRGVLVPIDAADLRQRIIAAIERQGHGFIALADESLPADLQIALNDAGALEIQDVADRPLARIPAIRPDAVEAPDTAVRRAVHVAKYRNVLSLTSPDGELSRKLGVELEGARASDDAGAPLFRPGDAVSLTITNHFARHPEKPNDPARVLNIAVLALGSDWSVTPVFPEFGAFEPLDPGQALSLPFEAWLPAGRTESRDILKVFATQATTDFRWLALPALDAPPAPRAAATRSTSGDPLERLLASVTDGRATTRELRIPARQPGGRGWTTAQVTLKVKA